MQGVMCGAMLAVGEEETRVRDWIGEGLSLAAVNASRQCVISGEREAIERLQERLGKEGVEGRRLETAHAFHSGMMDVVLGDYRKCVEKVHLKVPQIPYQSNVTGQWIRAEEATDAGYWVRHLRETVRFGANVRQMMEGGEWFVLEVGPGNVLGTLLRKQADRRQVVLGSLPGPQEEGSAEAQLLISLGRLWVAGAKVRWEGVYAGESRKRLSLPTYPFERQRYWVEPGSPSTVAKTASRLQKRRDIADWFYVPSWKRSALSRRSAVEQGLRWLVFADKIGLGEKLAEKLKQAGHEVISVKQGQEFRKLDRASYAVNPASRGDYRDLFRELNSGDGVPSQIAHLWSVTGQSATPCQEIIEAGFYSLLYLAQELGEHVAGAPLQLSVVSNQLHEVTGNESLSPAKATLLGPCRVIPQEYPNISCRSIDVEAMIDGPGELEDAAKTLAAELTTRNSASVVAWRCQHRWVETFESLKLTDEGAEQAGLKHRGTYLITGGLGGIGLTLAEDLARSAQARLVLVGRTALPPRDEWTKWLEAHDDGQRTSRKIRKLLELEAAGSEVLVRAADITDHREMNQVLAEVHSRFGRIHGVIHAAGTAGGGVIQTKTKEAVVEVTSSKVQAVLLLDDLLKNTELDFFVVCSSLASIVGGIGQVDYCAANAFLDNFARQRCRRGARTVSINWDAWREVGMAVDTPLPRDLEQHRQENLKHAIRCVEGAEAFRRVLGSGLPQVLVSTRELSAVCGQLAHPDALEGPQPAAPLTASHPRPPLQNACVDPQTEMQRSLASIWQKFLGIEEVGIHDNFFDLGGHSLLLLRVQTQIRSTLGASVPVTELLRCPTIATLADALEKPEELVEAESGEQRAAVRLEAMQRRRQLRGEQ